MNVYCDNYKECNSVILDWSVGRPSDDRIRAAGWRVWRGDSLTGKALDVMLCARCTHTTNRKLLELLTGQEELFGDPSDLT